MAGRFDAVKLAVEHVRNPGHGMPVRGMRVSESPVNGRPGHAILDGRVLQHITRIVIVSEIQPNEGQVHCQNSQHEPDTYQELARMSLLCGHIKCTRLC